MEKRKVELHQLMLQESVMSIADQLKVTKQAIDSGIMISPDQAATLFAGLDSFDASLQSAGFQRPAGLKVAKQAIDNGVSFSPDQAEAVFAGLDSLAATLRSVGLKRPAGSR